MSVSQTIDQSAAGAGQIDAAVAQGGAYEVLRKRLDEQGRKLTAIAETLNAQRLAEFGDSKMEPLGRLRIRTENNSVGRDIVQVGDLLLFGFNVFLGLKSTTTVGDVFSLHKLVETAEGYDVTPVELSSTFLGDARFQRDFNELYSYYKDARLLQLIVKEGKLLAAFQIGLKSADVRVFRWSLGSDGAIDYLDSRGERDIALPPPFDFEWIRADKSMEVSGRFPHLNILDTVFLETTNGDLTLKVENNTESGAGVYSEPVEDRTQSLDDAQVYYAKVGSLILLKVLPYRETIWRGLVFNSQTGNAVRLDAIVQACIQLPEDHGIIFPGGYYLQNGEHKAFDTAIQRMQYKRAIRSPNGEDVLYIFYERETGQAALLIYNMIQRRLQPPILAHGYARLQDGRMVLFQDETNEPTRVHQMQVWRTPFASEEFAAKRPQSATFMGRLGNAELVRAISNLLDLGREIEREEVSAQRYQQLTQTTRGLFDQHHWIDDSNADGLASLLHSIAETGEAVLDEYQKVQEIRRQSDVAMTQASAAHRALIGRLQPESWSRIQEYVEALNAVTQQNGRLLTVRDMRYVDTAAIDAMVGELQQARDRVGAATSTFLTDPKSLAPFTQRVQELDAQAQKDATAKQLGESLEAMQTLSADLDMLSELMASLKVDDAAQRAHVVDAISGIYAQLNQARARVDQRRKNLGSAEAVAQFGAQFALFGQSVASALSMAKTPERADEQLARLLVQLEELEGQFGEHERFLGDILEKREELLEAFETHKQALLDDRQRKAQSVFDAANRILEGLSKRTERFTAPEELNAFFAGDPLILKLRELAERLRALKDNIKADDVEARIKAARDQAVRALRDRSDLFEQGGNVIKLGPRHRFSVNTQPLDLTLLPREEGLAVHLTGTNFMEPIHDKELDALREFWSVGIQSESPELYRAEYLAGELLSDAIAGRDGLNLQTLEHAAADAQTLDKLVRDYAAPRYREGYEKGIHDHDAAVLLRALLPLYKQAGALIHAPASRTLAVAYWAQLDDASRTQWTDLIGNARSIDGMISIAGATQRLREQLAQALQVWQQRPLAIENADAHAAAGYLIDNVRDDGTMHLRFTQYAQRLLDAFDARRKAQNADTLFQASLQRLRDTPDAAWALMREWLDALVLEPEFAPLKAYVPEAIALFLHGKLPHTIDRITLSTDVNGLLGEHPRIQNGVMSLSVDDFLNRWQRHTRKFVPAYRRYQQLRSQVVQREREAMRLSEFKPKPLTSFVRNRLINDVYLAVIGDNLAKQMGAIGEAKRSDLMGLLMMISPPGYGKTTLMEYVAHRLGLIFMKINGPALGHAVRSLDPAQAPDATSRQELEKLNLALEMGNNVMLYVDDIQHTHPEFLQKFISLCDGTRRIEGVWRGKTKTYDMRGRKFAVVMAGNPYTESGEVFKIPDMLANRADIYNLGDVLGGMEEAFKLSYIENSLTSNPVLAPLATRDMADLYLLADKAAGKEVSTNALSHAYSGAEINEIVAVLQRLMAVREVVYRVNQQYIASAAQADKYRTEPPFKLQGSYRNMNKLAEKISPVMNEAELQQLISDHYLGEAQLLTTGAEENLLKLGELRGTLSETERARWAQIKADFLRNKAMGAEDANVGGRVVAQLADIASNLQALRTEPEPAAIHAAEVSQEDARWPQLLDALAKLRPSDPAEPSFDVSSVLESMRMQSAPIFESLQAAMQRQDALNTAVLHLTQVLQQGIPPIAESPAGQKTPPARTRRQRNPREMAFDKELERLEFTPGEPASELFIDTERNVRRRKDEMPK